MTRDELRAAHRAAFSRHWRTSQDRGGPTPELLDDLARIAEEYALSAVVKDQVSTAYEVSPELRQAWDEISGAPAATTLRDDYGHGDGSSTGTPPLAAADTGAGGGGGELDPPPLAVTPVSSESRTVAARTPRTRTRTRGGPK